MFVRLKAILLAMSFSVPVDLVKQTSTTVTTERAFIPPVQSVSGTSSVQTTGLVRLVSSSQPLTSTSSGQVPGQVNQLGGVNQPPDVPGVMSVVQPTSQAASSQDVSGPTARPYLKFTGSVSQSATSKMILPPVSLNRYCSLSESGL